MAQRVVLPEAGKSKHVAFTRATLQGVNTPLQTIVIRGLTPRGLGAKALAKTPDLGERVVLKTETGSELKAMVKWVSRDLFGLHFFRSLSRSQLEAIRGS